MELKTIAEDTNAVAEKTHRPGEPMTTAAFDLAPANQDAQTAQADVQAMQGLLAIPITAENVEWANTAAKAVRQFRKELEAKRDSAVKPLSSVVATIRGWFKDPIDACDTVYGHLTRGVAAVLTAQRAEQQRALAAAAASGAGTAEIARAVDAVVAKPQGSREIVSYSARVVDPALVPAAFLKIDDAALNAHARAVKAAFAVPGCELVREMKVVPM